jgi:hypothetical protein
MSLFAGRIPAERLLFVTKVSSFENPGNYSRRRERESTLVHHIEQKVEMRINISISSKHTACSVLSTAQQHTSVVYERARANVPLSAGR